MAGDDRSSLTEPVAKSGGSAGAEKIHLNKHTESITN
jgi:hypothetical protein